MKPRIAVLWRVVKEWVGKREHLAFYALAIFFISILSVGIVRFYTLREEREPLRFVTGGDKVLNEESVEASVLLVASKNGTRYYYPWCSGVSRLKEANKIWFRSIKEAEQAGYIIASGCE